MRITYYVRYALWLPKALMREFAYRFWTGEKSTRIWRDCNGDIYGPNMTSEEYDKWFDSPYTGRSS